MVWDRFNKSFSYVFVTICFEYFFSYTRQIDIKKCLNFNTQMDGFAKHTCRMPRQMPHKQFDMWIYLMMMWQS